MVRVGNVAAREVAGIGQARVLPRRLCIPRRGAVDGPPTREYPPEQLAAFEEHPPARPRRRGMAGRAGNTAIGHRWLVAGTSSAGLVAALAGTNSSTCSASGAAFGALQVAAARQQRGDGRGCAYSIVNDLFLMPRVMRQLAVVQFLSWFGAVCDVDLHDGRRDDASLRHNRRGFCRFQRGRQLGRRAVRGVQRLRCARGAVHPALAARSGDAARAPGRALARRRRPGLDPLHRRSALLLCRWSASVWPGRPSCRCRTRCCQAPCRAEDGHLHGHLQFLHRDPADPRGERARHLVRVLFDGDSIDALALGGSLLFLPGVATLRVDDHEAPRR